MNRHHADTTDLSPARIRRAIYRLVELGEWELAAPACQNPPPDFHRTLTEDVQITKQFLSKMRKDFI